MRNAGITVDNATTRSKLRRNRILSFAKYAHLAVVICNFLIQKEGFSAENSASAASETRKNLIKVREIKYTRARARSWQRVRGETRRRVRRSFSSSLLRVSSRGDFRCEFQQTRNSRGLNVKRRRRRRRRSFEQYRLLRHAELTRPRTLARE